MKKIFFITLVVLAALPAFSQPCYWVFLKDKQGTTFDPYAYFDAKAIARYQQCGADLYDISNYPLNEQYVSQVRAIATEEVGSSRWLNAIGVTATPDQIVRIEALPFVLRVQQIDAEGTLASHSEVMAEPSIPGGGLSDEFEGANPYMADQLVRQGGLLFREKGINGKGIRIAVFDGGFPHVNTHAAFKHLRDNGRIIKTWNFPNKKEDVYGYGGHGTMTLSCITGIMNDTVQIGLATGSEFLLARTEVETEPKREEIWWAQAAEWADKNGAQIISSSLGYGDARYYTKDMDGTSYVAKAANMAVQKGIVVCNSAGNEGNDYNWRRIVTPADAENVLCVGGICSSLTRYNHISFSSYGPTADGRQKPDVVNYGYALVADPKHDTGYELERGTSFSCPLTAGFVACAMQARPNRTALQMKQDVIESADLYPYHDYSVGYGVPQASYFLDGKATVPKCVTIAEESDYVFFNFDSTAIYNYNEDRYQAYYNDTCDSYEKRKINIFINVTGLDGMIESWTDECVRVYSGIYGYNGIKVPKKGLVDRTLNVSCNGYLLIYKLSAEDNMRFKTGAEPNEFRWRFCREDSSDVEGVIVVDDEDLEVLEEVVEIDDDYSYDHYRGDRANHTLKDLEVKEHGTEWEGLYFSLGNLFATRTSGSEWEYQTKGWSPVWTLGGRAIWNVGKRYKLGMGIEWRNAHFRMATNEPLFNSYSNCEMPLDRSNITLKDSSVIDNAFNVELFQRVRLMTTGVGEFNWDLGAYFGYNRYREDILFHQDDNKGILKQRLPLRPYDWGLTTRFSGCGFSLYARYRMTGLLNHNMYVPHLPRLEVGVAINLAWFTMGIH